MFYYSETSISSWVPDNTPHEIQIGLKETFKIPDCLTQSVRKFDQYLIEHRVNISLFQRMTGPTILSLLQRAIEYVAYIIGNPDYMSHPIYTWDLIDVHIAIHKRSSASGSGAQCSLYFSVLIYYLELRRLNPGQFHYNKVITHPRIGMTSK